VREPLERDGRWPLPYLHDESQEVARVYETRTAPHVFLIDAEEPAQRATEPLRCSVKWRRRASRSVLDRGQ
jgi:hypothetical protein